MPHLVGEAQTTYMALSDKNARDYGTIWVVLLDLVGLSAERYRQKLRATRWMAAVRPGAFTQRLMDWVTQWLRPEIQTTVEIMDSVVLEQLFQSLPETIRVWMGQKISDVFFTYPNLQPFRFAVCGLSQTDAPAMGRALPPQHDAGERELLAQGPLWRAGDPAMLRVLILALLWRGSLSQKSGYSFTVPQSVSVQEGLCILIPCTFAYPASFDTNNPWAQLYGYWFKDKVNVGYDPPVASSNPRQGVSQETQGRFQLTGDLVRGNCSLQIANARWTDAGRYFLTVKKGDFKYSYRSNYYRTHLTLEISVPGLTEKPEIQISSARGFSGTLLPGEPVTVTCTAPGRCSGPPPQVTWTGSFSNTARDVSAQLPNGTWARSSALSFTPTSTDHGKQLVCRVTFNPAWGPFTSRTIQLRVGYLPGPLSITGILTRNGRPDVWEAEGDTMSLLTHEGDSLTLSCEAGSRIEATLSWAKGNKSLSSGQGGARHLELPNLSRGDAGEYRCWAKNSYGLASRALHVHVESPVRTLQITISRANRSDPQLFQDPSTVVVNGSQLTAREGDSLLFLCSIAGSPPADLCWVRGGPSRRGHPLRGGESAAAGAAQRDGRGRGAVRVLGPEQGDLCPGDVPTARRVAVSAQAEGREAGFLSLTTNLLLCLLLSPDSPRPGTGLNSSCQRQGTSVSCSCSLRSHPPPRLQWQVDGKPVAGNGSWGALQVSSWSQGDEAVSTLSWTGSGDRGPQIFCLGFNPHGTYGALHFDFSPPRRGAEKPGKLLGVGVACGLGVAVGIFLLGLCVHKLRGREPSPPSTELREMANKSQAEHTANEASLIYSNVPTIPMDHKTPAARRTKDVQDGAAAAQAPLGPGEPDEQYYASINFSKPQRKAGEPPEAPTTEYSEVRRK
ncbi:sialic acid-binding Ig-like lectin 10 [Chrysemys picta bellii]|uniref:sialic acid-binding Ig-like lectin 10 n=1 Tax=Chrysemys picta bellii TaxID=8478 RepID=UPI0032B1BA27